MADTKVSGMTALTGAGVATTDLMPIIDVSATTAGSKKITMAELYNYLATILQPLDADLTTIAGLTATTDNFIQSKSSAWASRTPTQVTADLIAMVGDSGSGGTKGLVPAPAAGDAAASKFLKADGTWAAPAGGGTPGGSDTQIQFNDSSAFGGDADLTWNKTTNVLTLGTDALLRRNAAANFAFGAADAASPVAQTISVQNVVTGTSNTDGVDWTFKASRGTGTGAGGSIIFQYALAGGSGTAQNALANILSLGTDGSGKHRLLFSDPTHGSCGLTMTSSKLTIGTSLAITGNTITFGNGYGTLDLSSTTFSFSHLSSATGAMVFSPNTTGVVEWRVGTNPLTYKIYNTWTDASNGEWLEFGFATNVPYIKSTKNGTGTNRALILNSATGVINLDPNGASNFCFQVVTTNAYLNLWGKANGVMLGVDGTNYAYVDSSGITISSATQYQFGSSTNPGAGDDTGLGRAAAGIIKFTNGSTAGGGYATPAIAKTIASGAIAATGSYHVVDTEAAAATDDLDTISGGQDGQWLVLSAANSSRDVVVKDGTGNIQCAGDCTLDNIQDTITLIYNSTQSAWLELCRSNNGA